ncbi:MAG: TraR/DksA family transcriptional regulator [Bdellovibrionaceae bacterium]|nr:TraR/DksA family transcriptional regulator [Bdellovibrio sp.]
MKSTEASSFGSELDLVKKSLLMQKSEILNKHLEFKHAQIATDKAADEADAVVQDLQDNINIQLHERDQLSLLLIERALSKFADGTYGQCESCEEMIDLRRLKARPLATLCISCMEDQEAPGKNLFQ